ncbi:MAG: hypothetical protein K940chlam3_01634 [Chlamydiae bacterium]|nr:hypothetical protein [Chlamydiota bacterium]
MLAIFLDQETTGLDSLRHRTIDIAFKIIDVSTDEELASYESIVSQPIEVWQKHDPTSIQVNGFKWDDLQKGKDPNFVSNEVKELFIKSGIKRGKAVFICQNPSFDRAFFNHLIPVDEQERLNWPYHWLDLASMYWAVRMNHSSSSSFPEEIPLSKDNIAKFYGLPPEKKPHKAMNGVDHLVLCYKALFKK